MFNTIKEKWHKDWFEKVIIPVCRVVSDSDLMITYYTKNDWEIICKNENFLPEFIFMYPQYNNVWNWSSLSSNSNLTLKFILKNKDSIPLDKWDWKNISKNKNMTPDIIESNPHLPWVWDMIIYNPSIYQDDAFLQKYMSVFCGLDARNKRCNVYGPSRSYGFYTIINYSCMSFIKRNLNVLSYFYMNFWQSLSSNPHLTPEFIKEHIDKNWSWAALSRNKCITPELVNETIHFPWDWDMLSSNPSIPISFVEEHIDCDWNWSIISYEKVTPSFYLNHSERFPSFQNISINPNMIELIIAHPDWNWDWNFVSKNKAIPYWFVKENEDKKWDYISSHLVDIMYMNKIDDNEYKQRIPKIILLKNNMTLSREQYINNNIEKFIQETKENVFNQLMEIAWHPDRLQWVLDEDQRCVF